MFAKDSASIRNIALLGQAGAGKTTLAEALLERGGAIERAGQTSAGTTVCDFSAQEHAHQHSIDPAVCYFEHNGKHVNLVDAPGYLGLVGRAISVLPAVETVAVVLDAHAGIEAGTLRAMRAAHEGKKCRVLIVNKIDGDAVDYPALMESLNEEFGAGCLPLNLPSADGTAVVDCYFSHGDAAVAFSSVEEAHTRIVEQVIEVDEELMERYLEQGADLRAEELHDAFERALRAEHLTPVCFVSAETGAGLDQLLRIVEELMPNPAEGNPPAFLKGEGAEAVAVKVRPDADAHVVGHVFHIRNDPYAGQIGMCRIHQGTIEIGAQLFVGDGRKPFKVAHLYRPQGKQLVPMQAAYPGDICAFTKIKELHFDAVVHDSHDEDHFHLRSLDVPPPMYGLAIEPARRSDSHKLGKALSRLAAEDPSVQIDHTEAGETVLRGLSSLHVQLVLEDICERFSLQLETRPAAIPYRETITAPAEGHCRHKKQTGGAGQFGEVYLRVEPLPTGEGFEFINATVGGSIPRSLIPAVEKGVRQALALGHLAGFPIHDLRVSVYDGKTHPVDSKEIAFVAAGRKALLDAVAKAAPIVLEPIIEVHVRAPTEAVGDIMGDVSSRRGRVTDNITRAQGRTEVVAQVPLAELEDYQPRLTAMTGGLGTFTMSLSHYAAAPRTVQDALVAARLEEAAQ